MWARTVSKTSTRVGVKARRPPRAVRNTLIWRALPIEVGLTPLSLGISPFNAIGFTYGFARGKMAACECRATLFSCSLSVLPQGRWCWSILSLSSRKYQKQSIQAMKVPDSFACAT